MTGSTVSSVLKRIRDARPQERPRPGERCELCALVIADEHDHIVDLDNRSLMCACRPCYLVFSPEGAGGTRYRAVPDRYLAFADLEVGTALERLEIPVGVAFFFLNSTIQQLAAFYPSPAGATESLLPLDAWNEIVAANPQLATLLPDVEALLVRTTEGARTDGAGPECFLVPIDVCYELVGELRRVWRGFDGGSDAHVALGEFFARVRRLAAAGLSDAELSA
jgi:Family of unknown function (DUF5947)